MSAGGDANTQSIIAGESRKRRHRAAFPRTTFDETTDASTQPLIARAAGTEREPLGAVMSFSPQNAL